MKNKYLFKSVMWILLYTILSFSVYSLSDTNMLNNFGTVTVNVTAITQDFEIYIRPFYRNQHYSYESNFETIVSEHQNQIFKLTPISSSNTEFDIDEDDYVLAGSSENLDELAREFVIGAQIANNPKQKLVGLVPYNFFEGVYAQASNGEQIDVSTITGYSPNYYPNAVLALENTPTTTAHELGHTAQLCDELDGVWEGQNSESACLNGDSNPNDEVLDSNCIGAFVGIEDAYAYYDNLEGCTVEDQELVLDLFFQNTNVESLVNLMGRNPRYGTDRAVQRWTNRETYNAFINNIGNKPPVFAGVAVVISGSIDKSNNLHYDTFYLVNNSYLSNQSDYSSNGLYSIRTKDSSGLVINEINFTPIYNLSFDYGNNEINVDLEESRFIFIMPYSSVTDIELINNLNSSISINRTISSNYPVVILTHPTNGEELNQEFNATWNASDADNDTLVFAILLSEDSGTTWNTVAIDHQENYFQFDNSLFHYGNNYRIKIVASDSTNSASDESSSFTIIPDPSIRILSTTQLTADLNSTIVEFRIVNDGGYNLSNISWNIFTGETSFNNTHQISLNTNGKAKILFDLNYSIAGWKNISLKIFDPVIGVSDNKSKFVSTGLFNDIIINSIFKIYNNSTEVIYEIQLNNSMPIAVSNIHWNIDMGDGNSINSTNAVNILSLSKAMLYIHYNYSSLGTKHLEINAIRGNETDIFSTNITI